MGHSVNWNSKGLVIDTCCRQNRRPNITQANIPGFAPIQIENDISFCVLLHDNPNKTQSLTLERAPNLFWCSNRNNEVQYSRLSKASNNQQQKKARRRPRKTTDLATYADANLSNVIGHVLLLDNGGSNLYTTNRILKPCHQSNSR